MVRAAKAPALRRLISNVRYIRTLVIGEQEGGVVKPASISTVHAAKSLGDGGSISFLLAGSGPDLSKAASHASASIPFISQVLVAESDRFTHALAEPCSALIKFIQLKDEYSHVIAPANSFGKNILPRAAALLDVSPITDVVKIINSTQFTRPIYAGNALSTVKYNGQNPCMLTVRTTSFPLPIAASANQENEPPPLSHLDISTLDEDSVGRSRYVKQTFQDSERPDLGNARIVVTGGRGLKNAENFKMIEELAAKLGAAVGATRAAVDAGFVPNDLQVGQTGKIVAPELYMAFGVSGAIQHIAGMRDSKVIVAVNKDPDAPIFQVADYGLVGDLFEVIPQLIEKFPAKNQEL